MKKARRARGRHLTREELAARVRAVREASGLSREDFAERAGMHPLRLWRLENGRQKVLVEDLEKIAAASDRTVAEVYEGAAA